MGYLDQNINGYKLVKFLGEGGMGEVYRAVHPQLRRTVAVKILKNRVLDSKYEDRFINEARILAPLRHRNIATLYDYYTFNGRPCIVMEFVDGVSLSQHIRSRGRLPCREAMRLFESVVSAINYIHQQGIVHRDIKPNNIKISSSGQVKLLDFGIARARRTPRLTVAGSVVGTAEYLAPERIKGIENDKRSDIWALGILLYEMVTGRVPFQSQDAMRLYAKIIKQDYVPPSQLAPGVTPEVEAIIEGCLNKNSRNRYQTTSKLLLDVKRTNNGSSVIHGRNYPQNGRQNMNEMRRRVEEPFVYLAKLWRVNLVYVLATLALILITYSAFQTLSQDVTSRGRSVAIRIGVTNGPAHLWINGKETAMITENRPFELQATMGEHLEITLVKEGYREKQARIKVTGEKNEYYFKMDAKAETS